MTAEEKNDNYASCLLSIYDSLKLYDNDSLVMDDESMSELLFRKMKAYDIDLNTELKFDHLKPVASIPTADYFRLVAGYKEEMSARWIQLDCTAVGDDEIEYVESIIKVCERTYDMRLLNKLDYEFNCLMLKVLKRE